MCVCVWCLNTVYTHILWSSSYMLLWVVAHVPKGILPAEMKNLKKHMVPKTAPHDASATKPTQCNTRCDNMTTQQFCHAYTGNISTASPLMMSLLKSDELRLKWMSTGRFLAGSFRFSDWLCKMAWLPVCSGNWSQAIRWLFRCLWSLWRTIEMDVFAENDTHLQKKSNFFLYLLVLFGILSKKHFLYLIWHMHLCLMARSMARHSFGVDASKQTMCRSKPAKIFHWESIMPSSKIFWGRSHCWQLQNGKKKTKSHGNRTLSFIWISGRIPTKASESSLQGLYHGLTLSHDFPAWSGWCFAFVYWELPFHKAVVMKCHQHYPAKYKFGFYEILPSPLIGSSLVC